MDIKPMMRQILCVLFCMPLLFSLLSCDKNSQDGDSTSFSPSAALEKAFEEDFPGAVDVSWASYSGYAVVSFQMDAKSSSANYLAWYTNNSSPELVQQQQKLGTDSGMLPASVPQEVRESFNQSIYNNPSRWKVDEVEVHQRYYASNYEGSQLVYKIELEALHSGDFDVDLYYTKQGLLLKECIDYDEDRDYDWDDNDVPVSSDMMQKYVDAAKAKYPGYKVEELERLSTRVEGYTRLILVEMEKEVGGQEVEVLLLEDASWLASCFEIDYAQLPAEVVRVISDNYAGWEIDDDACRWETSDVVYSVLFSVEMEKEEGNVETEQHVFFSQDGDVVRTLSKVERN